MNINTGPISIDDLLHSKGLSPLTPEATAELARAQALDTTGYTEAEVRAYIIDPIVRVLGYAKGSDFSVDLERPITFLDVRKRPDYRFNLWEENFWLIEAKRPRLRQNQFGYADLAQALEYACHPEINAALVVLCDGETFEVFDREQSVAEPVLRFKRADLITEFDKLRMLLEPWQVWFFQKRRVARLIDKVFCKEFNLARVDEFKRLVDGRLEDLRDVVLDNFRAAAKDDKAGEERLAAAPIEELVDVALFVEQSHHLTSLKIQRLVALSLPSSFKVMYRIFPDHPRDANEMFYAHAATYLMALAEQVEKINWLPAWLAQGNQVNAPVEDAAKLLILRCLTFFEGDESRRIILLAGAAIRRVQKLALLGSETLWRQAEIQHSLYRYFESEREWGQFITTPAGQALGTLRTSAIMATSRFVRECRREDGGFNVEIGRQRLLGIWKVERTMLKAMPNYTKLRDERGLGDFGMTEVGSVNYDLLGHSLLCLSVPFPKWRAYIQENHRAEIEMLASLGSWSAREMLGIPIEESPIADDATFASRFFLGDIETFQALRNAYTARS